MHLRASLGDDRLADRDRPPGRRAPSPRRREPLVVGSDADPVDAHAHALLRAAPLARRDEAYGSLSTPRSETIADTSEGGVTSNAGLATGVSGAATGWPSGAVTSPGSRSSI